jgi:dihydrolipoamide dehydrogenase
MYDVIIIGGGPAGYIAAERLGAAKKKVLLVEERNGSRGEAALGGTCLNVGCVPTKTLLNSAKQYVHAKESAKFGIKAEGVSFDWPQIQAWKDEVVSKLCAGVAATEKRLGVEVRSGRAEIVAPPGGGQNAKVKITANETDINIIEESRAVLVCTGSVPAVPPIPGTKDNPAMVDSTGLLAIKTAPKRLVVIGGGVIGVEFAGLFSSLGSEVTVIEMMDEIVPNMDKEMAPLYRRALKGVNFKLGCKVEKLESGTVHYSTKDGKSETASGDTVLMAVGRRPVLQAWGAEAAGIGTTRKGVTVDEHMRTNIPGVWAAGDVTGLMQLAHAAYRQGEVAVADILNYLDGSASGQASGQSANIWRGSAVPWAVYGVTEAAGVGYTEQQAASEGRAIIKKTLPMVYSGRFAAENGFTAPGAVKVIADAETRCILGVHAVGVYASEFIWGGAALIEMELRVEDVKQLIFPHPTVSELIRDCVWDM